MGAAEDADPLYRALLRTLDPPGVLVELGCGRGRFLALAQESGFQVLGVDHDEGSVVVSAGQGVPMVASDIFDWLADSDVVADVIAAIHVVEHFQPNQVVELLTAIRPRLRAGGRLVLVTPNFRDWSVAREIFWLDPTHVRPYPPDLLIAMAADVGLAPVAVRTTAGVRRRVRARVRLPFQRLRYGPEFGKLNTVVILASEAP